MRKLAIAMLGAVSLAGCTTGPSTQVTRFHLNQPIAPGQISVEPMIANDRGSPEFQTQQPPSSGEKPAEKTANKGPGRQAPPAT